MARLTWEQVQAPDFRGVLDGYKAASTLIGNAMESAQQGIDRFEKNQTNAADNAVMSELLKYQGNPDALTAALGSGEFQSKVNMGKISAGMREHLSKAPADLLKFAGDKLAYDQKQVVAGQAAYVRENQDVANAVVEATMQGDDSRLSALKQARPDFFQKVDTNWLIGAYKDGMGLRRDDISNDDSQFGLTTKEEEQEAGRVADALYEHYTYEGTGEFGANTDRERLQKENPLAFQKLMARFAKENPLAGFSGSGGSGGGGGGSINAGAIVGSADDASAVREAASQLGIDAEDLAAAMSYETKGKFDPSIVGGKNNAHIGLIQFGTNEQKTYGIKPGMSIKEQMPAVVRYLKDRGLRPGDGLDRIYRTINGGNREANVKLSDGNGTIEQHIANIDRNHRGNARAFLGIENPRRAGVAVNTALAQGASEDPNRAKLLDFGQAWNKTSTVTEVAARLVKEGGAFAGADQNAIEDLVKKVMDLGVNNADVAAAILARNKSGQENLLDDLGDNPITQAFGLSDGLTQNYNWDAIKNDVALATDRKGLQTAALAESDRQFAAQQMATSTQQVNDLVAARDQARMDALLRGRKFDSRRWDLLIANARNVQTGAFQGGAETAGATDPKSNTGGGNRGHNPPKGGDFGGGGATEPLPVRQARNILKLGGKVGEKQRATFEKTYGMTPDEAIKNPGALPKTGQSVTVALTGTPSLSPSQMTIEANAALLQGAAAIKAFTKLYGQHPQVILDNM